MVWGYNAIDGTYYDGTYYSDYLNSTTTNSTTTATNDYFRDCASSFTTASDGTIYGAYSIYDRQAYTVPYYVPFIIGRCYYDRNSQDTQERVLIQSQQPQKTPEKIKEEKDAEKDAAERAKNLLLEYLDDKNRQRFLNKEQIEVRSKLFKDVRYHIPLSKFGKIKARKNDNVVTELCILVKETERLPTEDIVLAKLLHVMNDEVNMLKIANHSNIKENLLAGLN